MLISSISGAHRVVPRLVLIGEWCLWVDLRYCASHIQHPIVATIQFVILHFLIINLLKHQYQTFIVGILNYTNHKYKIIICDILSA